MGFRPNLYTIGRIYWREIWVETGKDSEETRLYRTAIKGILFPFIGMPERNTCQERATSEN